MHASATATRVRAWKTCSFARRRTAKLEYLYVADGGALVPAREFSPRAHPVPAETPQATEVPGGCGGWRALFLLRVSPARAPSAHRRNFGLACRRVARGSPAGVRRDRRTHPVGRARDQLVLSKARCASLQ